MIIYNAIMTFTDWMWTLPLLILLIGGGLVITIACDFVQIKHFGFMLRTTLSGGSKSSGEGQISGLQAMIATLANTIGTGNIVGVGSAIAIGGPGAIFWMWVIGFVAMALKYSEAVLGVATRIKDENGNWKGGANRYLSMVWKPLGVAWAISCVFTMAIACGVHTGSITDSAETFGIPAPLVTIIFTIIVFFVIRGGVKALVSVTDKLVPIMGIVYILSGLLVIVLNISNLIPSLVLIFTDAFTGTAATGGFVGATVTVAIRNGCARGVYSNDGGNGSASILHSQADIDEPVEQGMYGIFEVFACTMVICTFTALVVLCTGAWQSGDAGSVMAINAFSTIGPIGHFVSALSLILFAASSALSMATSSGILAEDLFGKTMKRIIQVCVIVCVFVGGIIGVDAALPWVDVCNMIMILFNVIGTLFLIKMLRQLTLDYFQRRKDKLI
ncbi:MAG: amino acid carrier protein [Lachnospiraceae bacterium]|nr:amino acid carrier protein [Lachnospiraceae bacterium]